MTVAGEPHVRLRGVTRVFPGVAGAEPVHALGPVDLDLRAGEFFSVVGRLIVNPSARRSSDAIRNGFQRETA